MKKLLLALACAILSLQAYTQPKNRLWDTKIRKTCFYGIAVTPVPIFEEAVSDAKKVGMVSIYDSINFVHEMNGYWYVLTDKGGDGYVRNLRYRPIDLDSLKNLEKYRLLALKAAKEKAARDSVLLAERTKKAYEMFDSLTAKRVVASAIWDGMTRQMASLSLGEPNHSFSPMVNGTTYETWEYNNKCLYFNGGCLEYHYDAKAEAVYEPDPKPEEEASSPPEQTITDVLPDGPPQNADSGSSP